MFDPYIFVSAARGIMEGRVIIQTLGVDLCACRKKNLCHIIVTKVTRFMKGSPACM